MANQAFVFNGIGTSLLLISLVLHILCLSMPYYSEAEMEHFKDKLVALAQKDSTELGLPADVDPQVLRQIIASVSSMGKGSVNLGMWTVCLHAPKDNVDICVPWDTETKFTAKGDLKAMESEAWMRAVQAMNLIGMILLTATLVLSAVNLLTKSKGDRLRFLYLFIIFFCIISVVFMLIGDIIMAANHQEAMDVVVTQQENPPPQAFVKLYKDQFSIGWCFHVDILAVFLTLFAAASHFAGGRVANSFSGVV